MQWLALLVAVALVGGAVAHETCHAAVGLLVGESVSVAWLEPATYVEYAGDAPRWAPVAVAVAPLAVGLVVAGWTLLTLGPPTLGARGAWWLGVAVLTGGGGRDEFRDLTVSNRRESPDGDSSERNT
jgi:hypothetical protein